MNKRIVTAVVPTTNGCYAKAARRDEVSLCIKDNAFAKTFQIEAKWDEATTTWTVTFSDED
jgi:metal-sulfur cluster biosynthetic enzyme